MDSISFDLCSGGKALSMEASVRDSSDFLASLQAERSSGIDWNLRVRNTLTLIFLLATSSIAALPAFAQISPSSTASSAANSAGTTVNNQNNTQLNTSTFYGFGPGINCPTTSLSISGFGGSGSGSSAGDSIGANVSSDNYGGLIAVTFPIGGKNADICREIGIAQVEQLRAAAQATNINATKIQADINLVTALKCVEILRVAVLAGPFESVCAGVYPRGVDVVSSNKNRVKQTFNP